MKRHNSTSELKRFIPELIEALVAALIVAIANILFPDEIDTGTNIVLGVISLSTLALTVAVRRGIQEALASIEIIRLRHEIQSELRERADSIIDKCREDLMQLKAGIVRLKPSEDLTISVNRMASLKGKQSVYATSIMLTPEKVLETWKEPRWKDYYAANLKAKRRGVLIERIFILNREDFLDSEAKLRTDNNAVPAWDILRQQVKDGMIVYVVWHENITDPGMVEDFVIFNRREMQVHWPGYGKDEYVNIELRASDRSIKSGVQKFEELRTLATKFDELDKDLAVSAAGK